VPEPEPEEEPTPEPAAEDTAGEDDDLPRLRVAGQQ
jgi:hypothetical protein